MTILTSKDSKADTGAMSGSKPLRCLLPYKCNALSLSGVVASLVVASALLYDICIHVISD